MAFSSLPWPFRQQRSSGGSPGSSTPPKAAAPATEDKELGVTPQLLDFVRSLSTETFKSCALQLQEDGSGRSDRSSAAAGRSLPDDLTAWQERHAVVVLSKAKEIAKIRYDLCPRHMKDKQFWRIYFLLAKSYITPYELHAVQKEKLKRMQTESGQSKNMTTVEVEMQESKCSCGSPTLPIDSESQDT